MTGVSVTRPRGQDSLSLLLPIASDPEGTSSRLGELVKATAEHMKAVELHGKADQIDRLLAEAISARKQADAEIKGKLFRARERAKTIVSKAEEEVEQMRGNAANKIAADRKALTARTSRVKKREEKIGDKESEIEPLHAEAKALKAESVEAIAKANRTRQNFERRMGILKEAAREAMK